MQKFNKGVIRRSANKIIAYSSCSQMIQLRFRTGKITATATSVEPSYQNQPQNGAGHMQKDTPQEVEHVTSRDPLSVLGRHHREEFH